MRGNTTHELPLQAPQLATWMDFSLGVGKTFGAWGVLPLRVKYSIVWIKGRYQTMSQVSRQTAVCVGALLFLVAFGAACSAGSPGPTVPEGATGPAGPAVANGIAESSGQVGQRNQKIFTASGIFVVPTGVTSVVVTMCGGGGAGGAMFSSTRAGGGGGGGQVRLRNVVSGLIPGQSIEVTVGAGGAPVANASGSNGGTSRFGNFISALGGNGGRIGDADWAGLGGGGGGEQWNGSGGAVGEGGKNGYVDVDSYGQIYNGGTGGSAASSGPGGPGGSSVGPGGNIAAANSGAGAGGGSLGAGASKVYDLGATQQTRQAGWGGGGHGGQRGYSGGWPWVEGGGSFGGDGIVIVEW